MLEFKSVDNDLARVRQRLGELVQCPDPLLDGVLRQLAARQGKMLRPALVLLFAKTTSGVLPVHINLAAVVELIHTASLLHDDVIDQAEHRRGNPSANALWGNTAAVLLGDFLLSRAISQMAQDVPQTAVSIIGQAAEALCTGELRQNLLRGKFDLTEEEYFEIIRAKTAVLFSCSCRLGVIASHTDERRLEAAGAYGLHLGLAFQIMDDLKDISSTLQREGKTLGTDFLHGKMTLPVIYWLNQNPQDKKNKIDSLAAMPAEELGAMLRDSGCLEKTYLAAKEQTRLAIEQLNAFAHGDALDELKRLAENIATAAL